MVFFWLNLQEKPVRIWIPIKPDYKIFHWILFLFLDFSIHFSSMWIKVVSKYLISEIQQDIRQEKYCRGIISIQDLYCTWKIQHLSIKTGDVDIWLVDLWLW